MSQQGYFVIGLGRRYIKEAVCLLKTLRQHGDVRPMSILVLPEDVKYTHALELFDKILPFVPADTKMWAACKTQGEKYFVYPRMHLDKYSLYDETVILDTDIMCMASTEHIWKYANHSTQSILFLGHANDPAWHWGHVNSVSATFKKQIPHIHGGFCYIRASEHKFIEEFFAFCRETFWNYDLYNCKRWYKGNGMTDEIIFAIAFAQFDLNPIDFDELPVMTFNVTEVPTCRQTEGGNCRTMSGYIPFNHTFSFKYGSMKHALVFNRIMKRGAKAKVLSVCINILCGAA